MVQYEVPKLSDLDRSAPNYMGRLEEALRRIELLYVIAAHEQKESEISFLDNVLDIFTRKGIEAKLVTNPERGVHREAAMQGRTFTLDGNLVVLSADSEPRNYARLMQEARTEYGRLRKQQEWSFEDREKRLANTSEDFRAELHTFTKVDKVSDGTYDNSVYYLVTADGSVHRFYHDKKVFLKPQSSMKDPGKFADVKLMALDRSFFDEQTNLDALNAEAEKLQVRMYVVSSPSKHYTMPDLVSYVLNNIEVPHTIGRVADDLAGKPTADQIGLQRLVLDLSETIPVPKAESAPSTESPTGRRRFWKPWR